MSRGVAPALAAVCLLAAACASFHGVPPLWETEQGLPGNLTEDRAVFGLVSRTTGSDGARLDAIRPLIARVDDGKGAEKLHVLAPIVFHSKSSIGLSTTVWPLFFDRAFGDEEQRAADRSDDDTWIFPVFAWGHEPGEGSYLAVFPLGGTLKSKLAADRVDFVAFPLYVHTQTEEWRSTHVLWPLIAWGESPTRSHFRVLPFWSQTDSPTRHERTLLWPIGHWGTETRGGRTFDSWFVFPLLGHASSRDGQFSSWTALYPFFDFSRDDKTGDAYQAILWPLYKHTVHPPDGESTWYWPFYGGYHSKTEDSAFYAWPVVWTSDVTQGAHEFHHRYVVPVWMQRSSGPAGKPPDDEELRSWPLFSWRSRPDGVRSVRVPEIIPFFGWEAGETLYADVLTLFRWRDDRDGRAAWDGPLGVVRYRRDVKGERKLTLLWWIDIPLGAGR